MNTIEVRQIFVCLVNKVDFNEEEVGRVIQTHLFE